MMSTSVESTTLTTEMLTTAIRSLTELIEEFKSWLDQLWKQLDALMTGWKEFASKASNQYVERGFSSRSRPVRLQARDSAVSAANRRVMGMS